MGNHIGSRPVERDVMAATNYSIGIAHPTVVPRDAPAVTCEAEEDAGGDLADAEDADFSDGCA
jgi:hypothetical protein